jgi:hypothetical protein
MKNYLRDGTEPSMGAIFSRHRLFCVVFDSITVHGGIDLTPQTPSASRIRFNNKYFVLQHIFIPRVIAQHLACGKQR